MHFIPYEPGHLLLVQLQPMQAEFASALTPALAGKVCAPGLSWTGVADGRILGCAGLMPQDEQHHRALAWAALGHIPAAHWPRVIRKMREVLQGSGFRRIEATVQFGFGDGCRLASLLGFEVEGHMRAYAPDGSDHFLYAKVA